MKIPKLNEGEIYIGAIINADGTGHHTILLPGDSDAASWQQQMDWAKSIGGDLPNRIEQVMLFEKFNEQFQSSWYWSNTQHANASDYAWYQSFYDGYQRYFHKDRHDRARAVRRVAI